MAAHNLTTVISFEFLRTVTKRRFWIISLAIPVLIAVVAGLITLSNRSTSASASTSIGSQSQPGFQFTYTDKSGLIEPKLAAALGGSVAASDAAGRAGVIDGSSQAYFAYPSDPATQKVEVLGQDKGIFDNGSYSAVASALMQASVKGKIANPTVAAIATGGISTDTTTYRHGAKTAGIGGIILPALYIALFFLSVIMLGNQMLNVTLEEKENRVTEMILTTMNPTTLIVGKVIALVGIGLVQGVVFAIPVALGLAMPSVFHLPQFDWSSLSVPVGPMIVGALLLVGGFLLFTGVLVAIGAVMPSAKEAGSAFGAIMFSAWVPFYAINLLISKPHEVVSEIFTFFPLTAPVTAMLRNATGSLTWYEAAIVLLLLFTTATVLLRLGVQIFRTGSVSYGARVNIRTALQLGRRP